MILLDDIGAGFPTFPQFVAMLREYERELDDADTVVGPYYPSVAGPVEKRAYIIQGGAEMHCASVEAGWRVIEVNGWKNATVIER